MKKTKWTFYSALRELDGGKLGLGWASLLQFPNPMKLSAAQTNIQEIMKLEDLRASSGVVPAKTHGISQQVHETIIKDCDFRKALAFGSLSKSDAPISYVRSLIQSGNLSEAKQFLIELDLSGIEDDSVLSLVRFEQMRISFFESDWENTIRLGEETLALNPPAPTRLAVFQLRANAYFERGQFNEVRMDLEQVEALGVLYPHAASLLYAQMLGLRVMAREVGPETALRRLDQLVSEKLAAGRADFDLMISYLRIKIDIHRVKGVTAFKESVGCFLLATAMGDKLYAGLAVLDMYCEFGANPP